MTMGLISLFNQSFNVYCRSSASIFLHKPLADLCSISDVIGSLDFFESIRQIFG